MQVSSVTVTRCSHLGALDVQQEAPSLNLTCIKPVNLNVVWDGLLTALVLMHLLLRRMFDVGSVRRIYAVTKTPQLSCFQAAT
jgi:hypothetical protein